MWESEGSEGDDDGDVQATPFVWSTVGVSPPGTVTRLIRASLDPKDGSLSHIRALQLSNSATSPAGSSKRIAKGSASRGYDRVSIVMEADTYQQHDTDQDSEHSTEESVDVSNDIAGDNGEAHVQSTGKERDLLLEQIVRFDQAPVSITRSEDWLGTWPLATQRRAEAEEKKKMDEDELPWHIFLVASKMAEK